MDAKQFLAEFGYIANAPRGISKLRELILALAVRGHLVSQSLDGSTSDFVMTRIAERKTKELKTSFRILDGITQAPYEIPDNWLWLRLGEAVEVLDGLRRPVTKHNRKAGPYPYYGASGVVDSVADYIFDEPLVLVGEDGAKWGRGENSAFRISGKTWVNNHAHVLRPRREFLDDDFLVYSLVEMDLSSFITGMTVPKLNQARLISIPLPLPPLEEQKRIVAKVDELMALCDKLEAQQQKRRKLQILTRTTALDALANAQSPHELKDAWFRLQGNLPLLFDMPEDVFSLKDLVLELASSGNLERNCQDDSDVWKLFNSIKDIQNKEFSNREKKELKQLIEPIQLKGNYLRVALGHIIKVVSGQHLKPSEYNEKQIGMPYITGPAEFGALYPLPTKWTEEKRAVAIVDDILLTVKGSGIGKTAICNLEKLAISRQLMAVRSLGDINREYLAICVNSAKKKFQDQKLGIAIPGIGREDVLGLEIVLPCLEEQERITVKVKQLLLLCHQLEKQLAKAQTTAKNLSQAAVASITGTQIKKDEKMKAPKTELVSKLKLKVSPNNKDQAPLSAILAKHNGELSSKALWNYSGMDDIDKFYQQLKTEMARDWIVEPEKARMIEKDADNQSGGEAG